MYRKVQRFIKYQIVLFVIALFMGILLCNVTADMVSKPAIRIMKIVTGGENKAHESDKDGIPKVFYPRLRKSYYNPVYIASSAMTIFNKLNDTDNGEKSPNNFLNYSNWLKNNLK